MNLVKFSFKKCHLETTNLDICNRPNGILVNFCYCKENNDWWNQGWRTWRVTDFRAFIRLVD